jgi:hypothetical protein
MRLPTFRLSIKKKSPRVYVFRENQKHDRVTRFDNEIKTSV